MQNSRIKSEAGVILLGARAAGGNEVYDSAGRYVGRIRELMFDIAAGRIGYVLIGVGGFLGVGQKQYAVPWNTVRFDVNCPRCTLAVDRAQLMDAPALDDDHWLRIADPGWAGEIQAFYGSRSSRP